MLLHKYIELKKLVEDLEPDIEDLVYHNSYKAGTSARKQIQDIRSLCQDLRKNIQLKRTEDKLERLKKKKNGKTE